jgi:hypothetical protein
MEGRQARVTSLEPATVWELARYPDMNLEFLLTGYQLSRGLQSTANMVYRVKKDSKYNRTPFAGVQTPSIQKAKLASR